MFHPYPVLGKRSVEFTPEFWVEATPAGRALVKAAQEREAALVRDPDYLGTFLKSAALGFVFQGFGEVLAQGFADQGASTFAQLAAEGLAESAGLLASNNLLRGSHKLLPLFFEPAQKEYVRDPDSRVGRSVNGWAQALKSLLEREFGPGSCTVLQEVRPLALPKSYSGSKFGAFDLFVAVHDLGHAVAVEVDEPCNPLDPNETYHSTVRQKSWDDEKDTAAGRIGLPVLRLAESQLSETPRGAMGLCLKFLEARTGLEVPQSLYNQYNWRQVEKLPRFTPGCTSQRVRSGWAPSF